MDPAVERNQATYRLLLEAIARPGRVVRLDHLETLSPIASTAALLDCLLDHEVSVCILAGGEEVSDTLRAAVAATGARFVPLDRADFVVVAGGDSRGGLAQAKRGTYEHPDEGATLIYRLNKATGPSSDRFRVRLDGPGIAEPEGVAPEMRGLPIDELRALSAVNADYPLGVDAFFVRPNGELLGIPRSTRIRLR
jgi:alpha-D-ribose 1-methylphosphonate 5-triphosphate synthase subunit PhnH